MSEQEQEQTTTQTEKVTVEKPIYPGRLAEYHRIKTLRESMPAETDAQLELIVNLTIAEQLAGLAYILDGIRFSARQGQN